MSLIRARSSGGASIFRRPEGLMSYELSDTERNAAVQLNAD